MKKWMMSKFIDSKISLEGCHLSITGKFTHLGGDEITVSCTQSLRQVTGTYVSDVELESICNKCFCRNINVVAPRYEAAYCLLLRRTDVFIVGLVTKLMKHIEPHIWIIKPL